MLTSEQHDCETAPCLHHLLGSLATTTLDYCDTFRFTSSFGKGAEVKLMTYNPYSAYKTFVL